MTTALTRFIDLRAAHVAQVVLRAAAQRRLGQAQHAPAGRVAIAAVARRAVVALHGVLADQVEESAILFLERGDDLELLYRGRIARDAEPKRFRLIASTFARPITICVLMTAIVARELTVDVGDDSRLRCAGKIVSGNDLIAESGKNARLAVAQDIPRGAGAMVTADDCSRAAEGSGQCKLSPS